MLAPQQVDLSEPVTIEDVEISVRRGAAKVPPVVELDGAQIDAIGAWDIGGVLDHLKDIYGGEGEPLVLINGQRVPLSSIFNSFPPDAAVRVEVLPPEAAGLYGGRAGQAVYNLVLQPRYASIDGGFSHTAPTQGGNNTQRVNVQRSGIAGSNSQQLRLNLNRDSGLLHGDRHVVDANGRVEDPRVSLRPEALMADFGGSLTRTFGGWGLMTMASVRASESQSVARIGESLIENQTESQAINLSLGLTGTALGWRINANSQSSLNQNSQTGYAANESQNRNLNLGLTANRSLFSLPAGEVTSVVSASANQSWLDTERDGEARTSTSQSQSFKAGINLPLLKAAESGLGRLGSLQADFSLGQQWSGDSRGEDQSVALAWQPRPKIRLNLSLSESQAGAVEALRNQPQVYGEPRTVYDFRRGEAVEILPLMGGNPDLTAPRQQSANLSLSAGPFTSWQASTSVNLARTEATNGLGSLGELTEEVQALFPERFVRDAQGRLTEVDFRPFNAGRSLGETLGVSLNLSLPLAQLWPERLPTGTTAQLRLGYNRHLKGISELLPGQPERDRLKGDGGGQSRQDLRMGLDLRFNSLNANINTRWRGGYRSRRLPGVDGAGDLVRDDYMETSLRLAWQIRRTVASSAPTSEGGPPRRRAAGSEISLDVTNLFDSRPRVRLGDGSEAPGYGRDRQDPMGRTIALNLRHRF